MSSLESMSNCHDHSELNHFLRLQQLQQQQQGIIDNAGVNENCDPISYGHRELRHQETPSSPQNIQRLGNAQQNSLDQLEIVAQNQQMLHRALSEGGRTTEALQGEEREEVDVNEQANNERMDRILQLLNEGERDQDGISIENVKRSVLVHIGLALFCFALLHNFFGWHSSVVAGAGDAVDHETNVLSTVGIGVMGELTQRRQVNKQLSSFEEASEVTRNPFLNKYSEGWDAIVKKFNEKRDTPMEIVEDIHSPVMNVKKAEALATSESIETSKITHNAGHSYRRPTETAPRSTPSNSDLLSGQFKTTWRNFGQVWKDRYQRILEVFESESYAVTLTDQSTLSILTENDQQHSKTDKMTRSILETWTSLLPNESNHSTRPTIMNTRERLRSVGAGEKAYLMNSFLSTCFHHIDAFVKFCEGRGKDYEHKAHESDFLVERLFASTPRLLAIATAFLVLTYLLHGAVADFFLGNTSNYRVRNPTGGVDRLVGDTSGTRSLRGGAAVADRIRRRRRGRERLLGYLLFKVLLISAVVEPDSLDLFFLLLWYSVLSFLRSLSHIAGSTIDHSEHNGQPPPLGALVLLLLVLFCDGLAGAGSVAIFRDEGWSMLLLLTCDCLLTGTNAISHIVRHVGATLEEKHRAQIAELEERNVAIHKRRRELNGEDAAMVERLSKESRSYDQEVETREAVHLRRVMTIDTSVFTLDLFALFITASHFLHIWTLHGASFGLVDGILLLHVQSTLSSAGRKIAERRNLNRILREIDETFNDASDLDIRKASTSGDVCCVCLVTMTKGNVKKLCCGHLFHKKCLREVVERARSLRVSKCPLCRTSLVHGTNTANIVNDNAANITAQLQVDGAAQLPTLTNDQQMNQNFNEQSLFRFSTEGILPAWLPVPALAFEVVRRETPALVEQNDGNVDRLQRFFRRGGEEFTTNGNQADGRQAYDRHPSFWRRLFVLAGAIPMSPEEEATALEQLVDMFPQYDRGDLSRELRARGSSEAVVESILLGVFSGTPRGMTN